MINLFLKPTPDEIVSSKAALPLLLIIWIIPTLAILLYTIGDLLWYFGNNGLVTSFYSDNFTGPYEANMWIVNQLGLVGMCLLIVLAYFYINITRSIVIAVFYE